MSVISISFLILSGLTKIRFIINLGPSYKFPNNLNNEMSIQFEKHDKVSIIFYLTCYSCVSGSFILLPRGLTIFSCMTIRGSREITITWGKVLSTCMTTLIHKQYRKIIFSKKYFGHSVALRTAFFWSLKMWFLFQENTSLKRLKV